MTTITNTVGNFVRTIGGVAAAAISKVVSDRVHINPLAKTTDVRVGVAPTANTKVNKTHYRHMRIGTGDGVTTQFSGMFSIRRTSFLSGYVNGANATLNSCTGHPGEKQTLTFAVAPANGSIVSFSEQVAHDNIDDVTVAGTLLATAGSLTRTNR